MLARVARLTRQLGLCVLIFVQFVNNFSADVAYAAVSDLLYIVFSLEGWIIRIKTEHSNSFCPTQFCYSLSSAPTLTTMQKFFKCIWTLSCCKPYFFLLL